MDGMASAPRSDAAVQPDPPDPDEGLRHRASPRASQYGNLAEPAG